MKRDKFCWFLLGALLFVTSCKQDSVLPIDGDDGIPDPVSDVEVENLPGGATITYNLPESKNLNYVEAQFSIGEDNTREEKVSRYKNVLTVEGFPDTSTYEGQLYAVSKGENRSEPVSVTIHPLTPPVVEVFNTIQMYETFGGVKVDFQNQFEAEVVFDILTEDSLGNINSAYKHYTQTIEGTFGARGFAAEERRFGVYVRDRWDNHSDTLFADLTPLFEEELDKTNFQEVILPTDTYEQHSAGAGFDVMWDGVWGFGTSTFLTATDSPIPQWFTFDMGVKARLNRFRLHTRDRGSGAWNGGHLRYFEVWGSNDPAQDGSWDSWTKLGDFESIKPSGEGPITDEDLQYAVVDGENFEIPNAEDAPAVQYLRIKTNETWGQRGFIYVNEITLWGNVEEE